MYCRSILSFFHHLAQKFKQPEFYLLSSASSASYKHLLNPEAPPTTSLKARVSQLPRNALIEMYPSQCSSWELGWEDHQAVHQLRQGLHNLLSTPTREHASPQEKWGSNIANPSHSRHRSTLDASKENMHSCEKEAAKR